jgi:hypothetical protein
MWEFGGIVVIKSHVRCQRLLGKCGNRVETVDMSSEIIHLLLKP